MGVIYWGEGQRGGCFALKIILFTGRFFCVASAAVAPLKGSLVSLEIFQAALGPDKTFISTW